MKFAQKALISGAMLGATVLGGAAGASFLGTAGAQTDTSSSTAATATDTATGTATAPDPSQGGHVANGITEAVLTGDTATKVTAAAEAAVPGATVDRVENDAEGATYEAHITKSDGSKGTVKINADFSVASIEDGMK